MKPSCAAAPQSSSRTGSKWRATPIASWCWSAAGSWSRGRRSHFWCAASPSPNYSAVARYSLDDPPFAGRTGRGVTVAVIDSGIHATHPHVGGVAGGVCLVPGADAGDHVDRIGHGTAVAAAIREKGPGADLLAVRVFDRQLSTTSDILARAIEWAA